MRDRKIVAPVAADDEADRLTAAPVGHTDTAALAAARPTFDI